MHSSSWYAKCYMPHVIDSPRSIELEKLPRFRVLSTGSFAPIIKWSTRPMPHGLFALPAAWERTCHFKHCSYAIFTSNTDEIRGGSIVNKNTLETCKNPRPTSGWSELTKSCTTSTMNFHMAYFSWIPQNNAKFKLSCKFGESKCNPC